ncbi:MULTISPECIES: hypothetical protein [Photorhabdus]|uniref:hypothetical protein n=1 Tax=Photorhabdus TaxID=29487 RepID=UPI001305246F|nr:hypothetical protein [Photorhabdus asymbiotica]
MVNLSAIPPEPTYFPLLAEKVPVFTAGKSIPPARHEQISQIRYQPDRRDIHLSG